MEKDIFQMTMSDFVEKYTHEKNEDGMPAIEISDSERFIIDKAAKNRKKRKKVKHRRS